MFSSEKSSYTKEIKTDQGAGDTNCIYSLKVALNEKNEFQSNFFWAVFHFNIWHDNENIYFKWFIHIDQHNLVYNPTIDLSIYLWSVNFE